eukprot:CAMPEP_0177658194 /NCGR_PEP_ID=MMETSP0447-20121125/16665_1 /TAXON_ID=0 /ORGANISM="Stygamoeba regulata, Strain BSH-02190019" /LENGTH=183 /DNA_ID=CAMNT_0019162753 /DNA_START=33 /DNA_END=581 /DNA_ORIENTATION=-
MSQYVSWQGKNITTENLGSCPFATFRQWLDLAKADGGIPEPNAMYLSTIDDDGYPACRVVLLKGFDERGFQFFTNYESNKGNHLAKTPKAAMTVWWGKLERQVRIVGDVTKLSAAESDQYFSSRPHGSQLGAWVSNQSREIIDREVLEKRMEELREMYPEGTPVPRPPHWGGYCLTPLSVEFW